MINYRKKKRQIEVIILIASPMVLIGYPEDSHEILQEGERLAQEMGDERNLTIFSGVFATYYQVRTDALKSVKYGEKAYRDARKAQDVYSDACRHPIPIDVAT